jgi:adenine deaminase
MPDNAEKAALISIARGERPADLLLINANVINVFTGAVEPGNVAVYRERIAGIGNYTRAKEAIDLKGRYLAPGFIDGHVHLESSFLTPGQYARAVVPHGTLVVITDLHEIANVNGTRGMKYILDSVRDLPLDVFLMAPSCVPATHLETSGALLDAAALAAVLRWQKCIGLGEMMNYPGVLSRDKDVLAKLELAGDRPVDGHAPGLRGDDLGAYIAAGIYSDHESVSLEEAQEKLRRGMYVMIREGSTEKNLEALLPLVADKTMGRCMLVVDDCTCVDLLYDGDIDAVVRKAIRRGLSFVRAVQLVTINPARYFGLNELGAIAPGYRANMVVIDDVANLKVSMVFRNGRLVARDGKPLFDIGNTGYKALRNTMNIKPFSLDSLKLMPSPVGKQGIISFPVIEVVPGQIITRKRMEDIAIVNGYIEPDISRDLLKLVVVERHKATGNIGVGLVTGFGLKQGALASSVAHDSHNIVAVGVDDESIYTAIKEIERCHGGLVAARGGEVLASLALPVAGILSDRPLEEVVETLGKLEEVAEELGAKLPSPFSTLSFLALPVIPELRLTDLGLVDVNEFKLISYNQL